MTMLKSSSLLRDFMLMFISLAEIFKLFCFTAETRIYVINSNANLITRDPYIRVVIEMMTCVVIDLL